MSHKIFGILKGWRDAERSDMSVSTVDGRWFSYSIRGYQVFLSVKDATAEKPETTRERWFNLETGTCDASNTELDDFAGFLI